MKSFFGIADFRQRHHAGVARHLDLAGEDVHDAVDVLGAQAILVAVLDEALRGVHHEDALAGVGVLLVEHEDAGRSACAVEEVGRQADDALDVAPLDDLATDGSFGTTPKEDAVR